MSETEKHIGKLVRVGFNSGECVSETITRLLKENNIEMATWHDDELECFRDELYEDYVIHDGAIYEVRRIPLESYDDISYAAVDKDGNIDFVVEFYNGGCSFSEAIEDAIGNIK